MPETDLLLRRGIAEVIDRERLQRRLDQGDRLRVKLGIDPTGAQLHLGHAVVLRILRRFQDLGHTVVLIVGDFTASIGDPSGKNETRPPLTTTQIRQNYRTYEQQALKILRKDKKLLEVRYQMEWYKDFKLDALVREASKLSVGWLLSHETFRQRVKNGQPLAFHELFYPILQAYDSIVVKPDVEIGGLDQKFNLLTGREFMKAHGVPPQDVVLAKYLMGTDGQKMGKSLNNFIAIEEEPFEMFGKIMSLPDTALRDYYELATDIPVAELPAESITDRAARDAKLRLAGTIVGMYHGAKEAKLSLNAWNKQISKTGVSSDLRRFYLDSKNKNFEGNNKLYLHEVLVVTRVAQSKSEACRLFEQGAVTINGRAEKNWKQSAGDLPHNTQLVVGKRKIVVEIMRLNKKE
ncbi:MAG: tyrosine--tRNA ligase [Candidatus Kerfeldbacteria bacterium]